MDKSSKEAARDFSLIETLLWAEEPYWPASCVHAGYTAGFEKYIFSIPGIEALKRRRVSAWQEHYFLFDRHMARLQRAASFFSAPCVTAEACAALEEVSEKITARIKNDKNAPHVFRVRLLCSMNGKISAQFSYIPVIRSVPVRFDFSRAYRDPASPFTQHKTTRRRLLETELEKAHQKGLFERVFVASDGLVTEGTFTNIFIKIPAQPALITPPVAHGLLAGTLREELLTCSLAVEAPVPREYLDREDVDIYLGNSLRGLVPAKPA